MGKSDEAIVVMKQANKTDSTAVAERVERRVSTEGNSSAEPEADTQRSVESEGWQERIGAAARKDKELRFTNLLHHIDTALLWKAYDGLNKNAMSGVDGESWSSYGDNLIENLEQLHDRIHRGRYRTKPVLRIWLDKPDGTQRPISVTCLEDKIVQQALVWVLECIYEQDFLGFSYGFRPGKSQHNALDAVYIAITQRKVSYILDADIKGYFDNIDQQWLIRFVEHRIGDRRIVKMIQKILQAGIQEDGRWSESNVGIPQGAVLSPLLANIYLHYALDQWAHLWRQRKARGEVYIIRYADDVIGCFQHRSDGQAFRLALERRLKRFNLQLHPEKTKLIAFGRFAQADSQERGTRKPETFDFLGFTHACAKRRKDGKFTIRRQTIAKRQRAKLKEIRQWLKKNRHMPVEIQGRRLNSVIRGAVNYYGVPGNLATSNLRTEICKSWYFSLRRRSQKAKKLTWKKMQRIVAVYIPKIHVTHPYPNQRLRV